MANINLARARQRALRNAGDVGNAVDPAGGIDGGDVGIVAVDPTSLAGTDTGTDAAGNGDGNPEQPRVKRKYTRRTEAGGTGGKTKAVPATVGTITELLVGIHFSLAAVTNAPELAMDEAEAETLAKAYLDMQRHYSPVVSGKTMDTMRFCMVAATIYGGRIVRLSARRKAERATPKQRATATVVPMPQPVAKPPEKPAATGDIKPTGAFSFMGGIFDAAETVGG